MRVTLFLQRITGAGGSRVTVRMANELARRGVDVRIAVPQAPIGRRLRDWARGWARKAISWEHALEAPVERYRSADELDWRPGDAAVAVGSHTVAAVGALSADGVVRVAWCHGFTENLQELMRSAWSSPLPKLVVSPTLIEPLKAFGGGPVVGVAPNGIDPAEYFVEDHGPRDGVGLIYSRHWKKDPEFTERVIAALEERRPDVPLRLFGLGVGPASLKRGSYLRGASVDEGRGLYNRALAWLITSRSEGFCLPILEAMACGAAVVSTAHDSAPGLVDDGTNGVLVPMGDLEGFVAAVERVLDDAAFRERLVDQGLATAARFTWSAAAEALLTGLERAGARPAGAPSPASLGAS